MTQHRKALSDLLRPRLKPPGFGDAAFLREYDRILDEAGVPRDPVDGPGLAGLAVGAPQDGAKGRQAPAVPGGRLTVPRLRERLGLPAAVTFDAAARSALFARLSNRNAAALTDADFERVAAGLGVSPKVVRAVRKVEAPRGPFDDQGRPSILYEKHVFARNTEPEGRFNRSHPGLSASSWQPGTYGAFSIQYDKLADACALDPEAAFRACSWGAFQVLGENAVEIGYASAFDMALALTQSEAAHLDCFVRFVRSKELVEELRACRPGDPASCVPFVRGYNGAGYARNAYHEKLAEAAR